MKPHSYYEFTISEDLEAYMERSGADYTGVLIVKSEMIDDEDHYELDEDGEWQLAFDSLSNRMHEDEGEGIVEKNCWNQILWEESKGFAAWAEEMKKEFTPKEEA
jgi:hypothetical protein